jgi:hypothetical protein
MFNKLYQFLTRLFKPHSGNPELQNNQPNTPEPEKVFLQFLWIKIDLTNPSGKAIFVTIVFLIAVILIILFLRDYIHYIKDSPKTLSSFMDMK